MKKAALTIGLLSLVVVTTSFTMTELTSSKFNKKVHSSINPKGSHVGGDKKMDLNSQNEQSIMNSENLDFTNVNQSFGLNKKQD